MSVPGPVVIGGMGGSGTRLPAHLLRELGFYIGDDLNAALDNLWFALLFRRPEWYRTKPAQVPIALRLFDKAMKGSPSLEPKEHIILRAAIREKSSRMLGDAGPVYRCARSMRASGGPPSNVSGWGWKNPSTHIYLEELAGALPDMKYIHVVRTALSLWVVTRPGLKRTRGDRCSGSACRTDRACLRHARSFATGFT